MMLSTSLKSTVRTTVARSSCSRVKPCAALLPGSGRSPARNNGSFSFSKRGLSSGVTVNASGFDALISK